MATMETFGLRKTQSLKNLSGFEERSWSRSAFSRWERKSVSQLVQHYQSCADLRSYVKTEQNVEVDDSWRKQGSRDYGSERLSNLTRSVSMDFLSQKENAGTKALCALFESKGFSNLRVRKIGKDSPLQAWSSHNSLLKDTAIEEPTQRERGKTMTGLVEYKNSMSGHSHDNKSSPLLTKGGTPTRQTRDRISTSASVRDRSALYLSRAAATDSTGGSTQPETINTSGSRAKNSKMAEEARKVRVTQSSHDEDDLPLPPPPPVPPRPLDYEGPSSLSNLPVPPPKETFSMFYQQRQKSELKRLFKHIHPDLHASLDDAVDDDIMKAVESQNIQAADAAYQGEVQSMRWIFENWTLDNIGDPHATKKLLDDEELRGGDVRSNTSMFENYDSTQQMSAKRQTSVRGDVRTSTWLFETQPLDSLNESKREDGEVVEAVLKEPIQSGDVRGTQMLFESKPLAELGRCNSIEDHTFLKLKSELQEQKGDVQKTVKLFQTEPCCAIKDNSGNIHEIKSVCREEINSNNISTARWLFETKPLDVINKGIDKVKIIRGISLEEGHKGGFDQKRWMFETQSFDTIQEAVGVDKFEGTSDYIGEADVDGKRKLFEMQPLATLKGDSDEKCLEKEVIVGGDVKTSLWLFETQPMEALSDSYEVGSLKKISLSAEEQGEVKGKKQIFERSTIQKETSSQQQEIERGDVKGFKQLFETIPLSKIAHSDEEATEKELTITAGNVQENTAMFEQTPLYAIKDSSGNLHKVTTVSREEFIKGKVKNYKWMFETKPLDQLVEGNVEVIKGITRQEDNMGDVKMAKWLFETQTIDGIHSRFNQTDQSSNSEDETRKGDVKTCKWLFETQPMDILYDKSEKVKDKEAIDTDVKSMTWRFESQPLDSIKDGEEYTLKLCGTLQDYIKAEVGVQTVKHLFETETLDRIRKDSNAEQDLRCISQVNFQSGDVSRVKELFESQSLNEIGSEMVGTSDELNQEESVEKGSVNKFTWMFENCPMNLINKDNDELNIQQDGRLECGDVQNKRFIFETSSLDKIHAEPLEQSSSVSVEKPVINVDVKSSTMMFESLPLYAIRDKEGQFHEVTTVQKEEVMSGDVRGARWMFETKPLDAIKAENDVYVIRAVTQEDVKKGDVKSARWKFETQPLDSLTDRDEPFVRVTEDFGSTNVQLNKQKFESEQSSKKFVRMVSVTDVQHGDVRTSTWLFDNQTMDSLKGEPQEQSSVKTVHREDSQKGDVKRCTWLFESQPLDKFKEPEDTSAQSVEEIPKADVKCTTWLFETTPLDKITADSVTDTLSHLHQMAIIHSSGIIIEAKENRNVKMAKYQIENNEGLQIQKEEVVGGNIRNIMFQLLLKPTLKPQITLLRETGKGNVKTTVVELPVFQSTATINTESDQRIQNIAKMIDDLLVPDKNHKKGIIMQETSAGQAEMSVYSLICNCEIKIESHVTERGDVKSTIGNLLATAHNQKTETSCRVDETEKGNVNLYKSCIEKGDLHYLKSLHTEVSEDEVDHSFLVKEQIETVQGGVKDAKKSLSQQKEQVERTISDVLPGDVKNTKKVFSSECSVIVDSCIPKEEIVPGDVLSAKQQLAAKQQAFVEKEEIISGDIKATMESLERAKQQSMCVEREVITPGTIYDMDLSVQDPETQGNQVQKEVIVSGDVKAAKKSLELAKQQSMHLEREVSVPGKIYNLNMSAAEERSSTSRQSTCSSSSRCQQIKTFPKVSEAVKAQGSHMSFETCQQGAFTGSSCVQESLPPFVGCEINGQTTEDEAEEVIRGDVKAAIRSLQSTAAEQKVIDKENIVRGNVQLALESLEKSSVNVSKGDYKAAMIYRNSGKACSERSKTVNQQCVVVSVPPSDRKLSPSISVTCEGQPSNTTQNSTPNIIANGNSKPANPESVTPSPLPQRTEKPQEPKPALPPKPQWTKSVVVEEPNTLPTPVENASHPGEDNLHSTGIPQKDIPPVSLEQQETSHKTKCDVKTNSKAQETRNTNKTASPVGRKLNITQTSNSNDIEIERNVIQKINAAEEIQTCLRNYAENDRCEMNMSLREALQSFERKESESLEKRPSLSKKVKVTNKYVSDQNQPDKIPLQPQQPAKTQLKTAVQRFETDTSADLCQQNDVREMKQTPEDKVVLRQKKVRETEDERRQRLSVHKEEIMKGNVKAAMEIFENIKKREELKGILSQVQEIEGETSSVDSSSLKNLYENVPAWMVTPKRNVRQSKMDERKVEVEIQDDDLESISSVDTAFEDLEKASKDIMNLKEQTLAKLLDIEETIKKALYSVSNLKSEADIAGLSGLFDESLKSEPNLQPTNNIRKISIMSSKAKAGQTKGMSDVNLQTDLDSSVSSNNVPSPGHKKPLTRQSSSQSSPSFISIHSAARKTPEQPKPTMSTFKPNTEGSCQRDFPTNNHSPQRKVSVLEVKTVPEQPAGMVGTKTVNETYEETDGFGNVFVSSTTSTFVTKQSDSKSSALFEVIGSPTRYEVMTSPLMQRSARPFEDKVSGKAKKDGTVFVTFSQPKEKH